LLQIGFTRRLESCTIPPRETTTGVCAQLTKMIKIDDEYVVIDTEPEGTQERD